MYTGTDSDNYSNISIEDDDVMNPDQQQSSQEEETRAIEGEKKLDEHNRLEIDAFLQYQKMLLLRFPPIKTHEVTQSILDIINAKLRLLLGDELFG